MQSNCRNKKKITTFKKDSPAEHKVDLSIQNQEVTEISENSVLSKLSSIDKISKLVKEKEIVNEKKEDPVANQVSVESYTPVGKEAFSIAWQDYMESELKNKSKNLWLELRSKPPVVQEDGSVVLVLENASLLDMFQKERIAFVDFLAEKYSISGLKLILEIKKEDENDKYSYMTNPKEIFEFMASRNRNLIALQKSLNLRPV